MRRYYTCANILRRHLRYSWKPGLRWTLPLRVINYQISPAASAEIFQHTAWITSLFVANSDERWLYCQFSLPNIYIFSLKCWENVLLHQCRPSPLRTVCTLYQIRIMVTSEITFASDEHIHPAIRTPAFLGKTLKKKTTMWAIFYSLDELVSSYRCLTMLKCRSPQSPRKRIHCRSYLVSFSRPWKWLVYHFCCCCCCCCCFCFCCSCQALILQTCVTKRRW